MSLDKSQVIKIRDGAETAIELEMSANNRQIAGKKIELEKAQEKLFAVEESGSAIRLTEILTIDG